MIDVPVRSHESPIPDGGGGGGWWWWWRQVVARGGLRGRVWEVQVSGLGEDLAGIG